ncbi:hemicentin-2-like isoform X2 [Pelmatolapia mariae]
MKDGDVSLILRDVTINDNGIYECRAQMKEIHSWKNSIFSVMDLTVVVPPDKEAITAVPGQNVTLTCQAPNNNITFVEWSRADLGDKNVLLYQDGRFVPDDQHPSFKNRVDLQDRQMKDGDVSLILKDVTINDAGTYECRAFMVETLSWQLNIIYLRVVPPDQKAFIKAVPGQDVALTCRAPNNNITFVEWSRADLVDKHVLLYRDGHFEPDNQHPSFKNRVNLQDRQMKDGDVSLILKDVMFNDAGTYECHVQREGDILKFISIIYLRVVPPDQKIITESGQDVTLTCRALNNNIGSVQWIRGGLEPDILLLYQDGHVYRNNNNQSVRNQVDLQDSKIKDGDVSLILKKITINDAGPYVCYVNIKEPEIQQISIIYLHVDPPVQENITAESGQNVTLTCRAPNNNIIVVEWSRADLGDEYVLVYRDEASVLEEQHPSFKNRVDLQDRHRKDGDVSLILNNVTIIDAGIYECRVFMNESRPWEPIRTRIFLRVLPPDQKNITAESGQDVTLTCRAPNNNITAVKWIRADLLPEYVLLYQNGHFDLDDQHPSFKNRVDLQDRQMKDGDVSLILKNVMLNDAGTYECRVYMAETRLLKPISIITLKVLLPVQKNISAESGQDVTLPCRAPNNNPISVFKWSRADLGSEYVLLYRDEQFVPDDQHPSFKNRVDLQDRQMKDGDVSLILKNVMIYDAGTYECRVFMREIFSWKLISSINLHVDPPVQKIISAASGQDVTLTCRAPNNNIRVVEWSRADLVDEYVFVYRDGRFEPDNQHPSFKNRVDLQDRQMKDGDVSLILKNVTINDTGTYECGVSPGGGGILKLITIIHLHVDPPGQTGGLRVDGSVGLLIGLNVFAVFLVAVVIAFVIYRKYERENGDFNSY